ncbi:hypothetical protein EAS64_28465 [Trebonia kvetii]|uniref:Extradiol ring-cleavage dioxygenase class III enzyme subunit B domain-containing protein n=1 Tax=Trebonia kvetii TaxID=2480626 RepID=A0A6P2BZU3_9ACTN|nr:hypothetical protein [Trebonia kvetii]TVZ02693.1 hypothetical protein EAS64_28465 [Trebonia kvetii]
MIVSAAICPSPPLLARELTGRAGLAGDVGPLSELRDACAAALNALLAAAPDIVVVTGPAAITADFGHRGRLDLSAYAPALHPGGDEPVLPLSLGIGARLLDQVGYAGPRSFRGIGVSASAETCLRLGRQIAASARRVALLAVGDGSARRSVSAPGYLDERAAPFDESVTRAVRDGEAAALAALDPELAADLMADGRAAWQVLAGALTAEGATPGGLHGDVLYAEAPLGVAYLVAVLTPR